MTDYWKSGERHFCAFCKCWLAGNKVSIEFHERGSNHKNNVRAKVEQLRKASVEKERQEKQMSITLAQIDKAAHESFQRDVAQEISTTNQSSASNVSLNSIVKRPAPDQPVQIQCKKAKFVIKGPKRTPVYEPIDSTSTEEKPTTSNGESDADNAKGTWYESKTDEGDSFYWNDTTGESSWTPPAVYLSIEEQRARGLKV